MDSRGDPHPLTVENCCLGSLKLHWRRKKQLLPFVLLWFWHRFFVCRKLGRARSRRSFSWVASSPTCLQLKWEMSQFDGRDNIAVTDIVRGIDKQRWKQLKKYLFCTLCAFVKKNINCCGIYNTYVYSLTTNFNLNVYWNWIAYYQPLHWDLFFQLRKIHPNASLCSCEAFPMCWYTLALLQSVPGRGWQRVILRFEDNRRPRCHASLHCST